MLTYFVALISGSSGPSMLKAIQWIVSIFKWACQFLRAIFENPCEQLLGNYWQLLLKALHVDKKIFELQQLDKHSIHDILI